MDEKETLNLEAEKPVKKATTTKKKTTRSKAKKEVEKVAEKAAKEAVKTIIGAAELEAVLSDAEMD